MSTTGLPALAALAAGVFAFLVALLVARARRDNPGERGAKASPGSIAGIALQGAGFAATAIGEVAVTRDPIGAPALVQGAVVAAMLAATVAIFVAATRAMGRNWSLVARTRADHALVVDGPFAHVRHPIYSALALALVAAAIGLGHGPALLVALPLYAAGTWLRVRGEERLLYATFAGYAAYARRVRRFVPGVV